MRTDNELLPAAIAEHNNYRPSSESERIAREEADNVTRRERFYREWCRHEAAQLERDIAAARYAL